MILDNFFRFCFHFFSLSMYFVVLHLFLVMKAKLMGPLPRNLPQKHLLCFTRAFPRPYNILVIYVLPLFVKSFYQKQKSLMFSRIPFLMVCSGVVELPCLIFIGS